MLEGVADTGSTPNVCVFVRLKDDTCDGALAVDLESKAHFSRRLAAETRVDLMYVSNELTYPLFPRALRRELQRLIPRFEFVDRNRAAKRTCAGMS